VGNRIRKEHIAVPVAQWYAPGMHTFHQPRRISRRISRMADQCNR